MAALDRVWDCVLPFMFLFRNFFFFHVVSTHNASRTVVENALIRSDGEEKEEFPRSPFEIGTEEEGELSGEVEGEEGSQLSEMDKMKEALSKMEVKQNESQQMMGGMINLLQQMQMQLGTLSASMATLSSGVQ